MKKVVLVIVAILALLVSGGGVLAAGGYLSGFYRVEATPPAVNVVEPIIPIESIFKYNTKGGDYYPGNPIGIGYVILQNIGNQTYGIRPWLSYDSPQSQPPWIIVASTPSRKGGSQTVYNGIVDINPGETLRIDITITIDYASPQGAITNLVLVFDRCAPSVIA
ncbi:MAG: hypothetical protein V1756_02880 [Patescibacteria group bacterium]